MKRDPNPGSTFILMGLNLYEKEADLILCEALWSD